MVVAIRLIWACIGVPSLVVGTARAQPGYLFREFSLNCDKCSSADLSPDGKQVAIHSTISVGESKLFRAVQFWDYQQSEITATRTLQAVTPVAWDSHNPILTTESFIRYSPDGRFLLIFDGVGKLDMISLEGTKVHLVRSVELDLSPARRNFQPIDIEWSPNGRVAAVLLSWKIFHQGVVRLYNLESGELCWQRSFDLVEIGHGAWSADGRQLAVTLLSGEKNTAYPPRDIANLLVLSAKSGQTLVQIKTGDLAGPVCFGPGDTVLTAPLHFYPKSRNPLRPEQVKVWDARTGRLTRQIRSPGRDIHDELELSQDGRVLLGYVGKEKSGFSIHALEDVWQVIDRRFQLFDYKTGKLLATSPDLGNLGPAYDAIPHFRLSATGDRILVYWSNLLYPLKVFEQLP